MDRPSTPDAPEAPSRMRVLLASNGFRAIIIVLSAAIIFGAWAFAEFALDESPDDPDIVLSIDDDEYERARRAAEEGNTDEAVAMLERILAEDPDHARAAVLLRQLRDEDRAAAGADGITQPDNGTAQPGTTESQPAEDSDRPSDPMPRDYLAPVDDLGVLLPQVISGWRRSTPVVDETDATVAFSPAAAGDLSRVLYAVHDRQAPEAALEFIEMTSKVAYRQDGTPVRVGTVDGYFGTDGSRLATVAFARGRFAFEVVITVPDGNPVSQKDAAIVLAREFEAAR